MLYYSMCVMCVCAKPYNNRIVNQSAKLSFKALNGINLIFTLEEMKAVCPEIAAILGAIACCMLCSIFTSLQK